ncbi:hypothetical protein TRVL_06686 [Trypanosoma vivax]|nr:hypothetical protein TRVL_06686 [Trypanosoma vivax]
MPRSRLAPLKRRRFWRPSARHLAQLCLSVANNTDVDTSSRSLCLLLISRYNCASTPSMPRIALRSFRHLCQKLFFQCRVNELFAQSHHNCTTFASRLRTGVHAPR